MTYGEDSLVHLNVVALCFVHSFDFEMCMCPQVSGAPQIPYWQTIRSPSLDHSPNSTHAMNPEIGQCRNLLFSISSDFISYQSLIVVIENANEIPLEQCLITVATIPSSEFWFTLKWQRDRIYLCSIVCLRNDLFDDLYQLRRLPWLNV